jgi:cytochrome c nitrite reductase small subunit
MVHAVEAKSMPPRTVRQVAAIVLGSLAGLGIGIASSTFLYAQGWAYLTNNPAACANCHIMQDHYDAWVKSSHRTVATCNDCHTPAHIVAKYYTKADHGFWHSYAFTTGDFHAPIRMKARSQAVTESTCRVCHLAIVQTIETPHGDRERLSCIRCHNGVGHPK